VVDFSRIRRAQIFEASFSTESAEVSQSTSLISAASEPSQIQCRRWSDSMLEMGSSSAAVSSSAADHGQFRWRSWSIAVATVGRWLAFCN